MGLPSIGTVINVIVIGLFVMYMGQVAMVMNELFNPEQCVPSKGVRCVTPYQKEHSVFEVGGFLSYDLK